MDENTELILAKIHEYYCAKGLKKDTTNLFGFTKTQNVQSLEEIGRDELFRHLLADSCKQQGHNGIITRPSKKATVLVVGNHSAGKSSFINWYCGDNIQSTGIAIETSHFTMITYGEKENELRSEGTMIMYPFLREIMNRSEKKVYGTFFSNLNTKISSKNENFFQYVDFIDTPGLTDGLVKYNCDIIEMIKWISDYVDMVLIFLDPVGQALCTKTMEIISFLYSKHKEKFQICLSKIDQVVEERDFLRLNQQIHSSISQYSQETNIEIIPFTIKPDNKTNTYNKINIIKESIEKACKYKALRNIDVLTHDCYFILNHADYLISLHNLSKNRSFQFTIIKYVLIILAMILVLALVNSILGQSVIDNLQGVALETQGKSIFQGNENSFLGAIIVCIVSVWVLHKKKYFSLTSTQMSKIEIWKSYCSEALEKTQELASEYYAG